MFEFEYIFDLLKKNILGVIGVLLGLLTIGGSIIYTYNYKCPKCEEKNCDLAIKDVEKGNDAEIKESEKIKVDVKGAIKKPNVYEFDKGATVYDAVIRAGGITSKGTTININLSKKLRDEMVIYVFSKDELKKKESTNEVVCEIPKCECETVTVYECPDKTDSDSNGNNVVDSEKKISINTATLEELQTISGIGESKAKAIIEYRETNGNFITIEDIKKVSGIGDALYEKIKDRIAI